MAPVSITLSDLEGSLMLCETFLTPYLRKYWTYYLQYVCT